MAPFYFSSSQSFLLEAPYCNLFEQRRMTMTVKEIVANAKASNSERASEAKSSLETEELVRKLLEKVCPSCDAAEIEEAAQQISEDVL
jgi:ribosomal protein L17